MYKDFFPFTSNPIVTPSPTRNHDLNNPELTLPGDFQLNWPHKFDFLKSFPLYIHF